MQSGRYSVHWYQFHEVVMGKGLIRFFIQCETGTWVECVNDIFEGFMYLYSEKQEVIPDVFLAFQKTVGHCKFGRSV